MITWTKELCSGRKKREPGMFAKELKEKEKNGKERKELPFMLCSRKFAHLAHEKIILPILQVEIRLLVSKILLRIAHFTKDKNRIQIQKCWLQI